MSESNVTPFLFENEALVRVVTGTDGLPWFVAADVCRALGIRNNRDAVENLDEDEKGVANTDTPGGNQDLLTVSESGLYALIFRSRKPEAVRFRKWVTGEVLPSIRRTGSYTAPPITTPVDVDADEPLNVRRALVAECRQTFGTLAGRQLWFKLDLPIVPAMLADDRQTSLFSYTAIAQPPQAPA